MKRQVFDILVIGLLVGLAAASAQAQSAVAKANVRCDFAIGDTRLPAGEYAIATGVLDVAPELLVLRNGRGRVREVTMAARMEPGNSHAASENDFSPLRVTPSSGRDVARSGRVQMPNQAGLA